jgi:flagellin
MGLRINQNISAFNAHRNLLITDTNLTKSLERLSTGLRINRAADDASGLAVSEKLRAQVNGLKRASANAQDGISMLQTAEGALNETHSILQRMRELAVQAANGTWTTNDRVEMQNEADQLISEINRISSTTEFNTKKLLDGTATALISTDSPNTFKGIVTGDVGVGGNFSIVKQATSAGALQIQKSDVFVTIDTNGVVHQAVSTTQLGSISRFQDFGVFTGRKSVKLSLHRSGDPTEITLTSTDSLADFEGKLSLAIANSASKVGDLNMEAALTGTWSNLVELRLDVPGGGNNTTYGSPTDGTTTTSVTGSTLWVNSPIPGVDIVFDGEEALLNALSFMEVQSAETPVYSIVAYDIHTGATVGTTKTSSARIEGLITGVTLIFDPASDVIVQNRAGTAPGLSVSINPAVDREFMHVAPRSLAFQIGANQGQTLDVNIGNMSSAALGVDGILLVNTKWAQNAITTVDDAINKVSAERSKLGSYQNRLEHTIKNLGVQAENLTASESRIRDLDFADEMITFTRNQILMQSGVAMLAQANQLPQMVLQLIR